MTWKEDVETSIDTAIESCIDIALTRRIRDYVHMTKLFGIHFQIRDDYTNLQSRHGLVVLSPISVTLFSSWFIIWYYVFLHAYPKYSAEKGYCEDLTEGKFSFEHRQWYLLWCSGQGDLGRWDGPIACSVSYRICGSDQRQTRIHFS